MRLKNGNDFELDYAFACEILFICTELQENNIIRENCKCEEIFFRCVK